MGFANYISESEATNLCGVSAKTLTRFVEAGHLSVEHESDGLTLYCSEELEKIFGSSMKKNIPPKPSEPLQGYKEDRHREVSNGKQKNSLKNRQTENKTTPNFETGDPSYYSAKVPTEFAKIIERTNGNGSATNGSTTKEQETIEPSRPQALSPLLEMEQKEVARLRSLVEKLERINEVNEKIIDLREDHISQLGEERDWLRARVEKLEEKADRDQVLLLSETQLLRHMIEQKQIQRSPVRAALEWLGVVEPQKTAPVPRNPIVVE